MEETTYLVVDGENIDATLGLSVLDRRPNPEERPRWDRVLEGAHNQWGQRAKGLFFLNGSSGYLPMGFVQALTAMDYAVIPLSGPDDMKVVDVGLQRTMDAVSYIHFRAHETKAELVCRLLLGKQLSFRFHYR